MRFPIRGEGGSAQAGDVVERGKFLTGAQIDQVQQSRLIGLSLQSQHFLAAGQVPDLEAPVGQCRGQAPAVGADSQAANGRRAFQGRDLLAGGDVPDLDNASLIGRDQPLTIGGKGHGSDGVALLEQGPFAVRLLLVGQASQIVPLPAAEWLSRSFEKFQGLLPVPLLPFELGLLELAGIETQFRPLECLFGQEALLFGLTPGSLGPFLQPPSELLLLLGQAALLGLCLLRLLQLVASLFQLLFELLDLVFGFGELLLQFRDPTFQLLEPLRDQGFQLLESLEGTCILRGLLLGRECLGGLLGPGRAPPGPRPGRAPPGPSDEPPPQDRHSQEQGSDRGTAAAATGDATWGPPAK